MRFIKIYYFDIDGKCYDTSSIPLLPMRSCDFRGRIVIYYATYLLQYTRKKCENIRIAKVALPVENSKLYTLFGRNTQHLHRFRSPRGFHKITSIHFRVDTKCYTTKVCNGCYGGL